MTTGSLTHSTNLPADVASWLRLLADATDQPSFFATLRRALPALLPATRADLLVSDWADDAYVALTDYGGAPPAPAAQTASSLAEWLYSCGYVGVVTLPLSAAGQRLGWLALARTRGRLGSDALGLAGQLAALIALRLLYDQTRANLNEHDAQTAQLARQLHEHQDVRQRATLALGTAHDIGNLLASVMGHAQLLQHIAPASCLPDLRTIALAASDGHTLLRRLLATKTPRAAGPVMLHLVALPSIIQEALNLTRLFWEPQPQIAIRVVLGALPQVRVHPAELREVLINLIMNALAAMPGGGILTLRGSSADQRVLLEVTDTGRGIAPDQQATIFQPFISAQEHGNGLGLSVSRAIIESYGGTLTVQSTPGQGATFLLALPAAHAYESPALVLHARATGDTITR